MRIRRFCVGSFGTLRDKEAELSPGLSVIYGPNGCGKTSLAEFIGSCLAPSDKKDRYPSRSKDDRGSVTMTEHDEETTVFLRGRSRFGRVPECVRGISPELFRSVFSIRQESLSDLHVLTAEGSLGTRPLRVAAEALRSIEASVFGTGSGECSELEAVDREIEENDRAIDSMMREIGRYGEYASQRKAVASRMLMESDDPVKAERAKRYDRLVEFHREHYQRLAELVSARASLGSFEWAEESDEDRFEAIEKELEDSSEPLEYLEEYMSGPMAELGDRNPSVVLSHSEGITMLAEGISDHERRCDELRRLRAELAEARMGAGRRTVIGMLSRSSRSGRIAELSDDVEDLARRTEAYERMVSRWAAEMGLAGAETSHTVAGMVRLRDAASIVSKHREELEAARERAERARADMDAFSERFEGPEGFRECRRKTKEAMRLDEEIASIRALLASSGLDPDAPVLSVEYIGVVDGAEELRRRLESLDSSMSRIMDSEELDALLDRRSVLASRRNAILRKGVDAAMGLAIARMVDARSLCPEGSEWERAGAYLSEMTGEECSIRYEGGFLVDIGGTERRIEEIGSGAGRMASLALKAAAAERIGDCEMPLVLDDVLIGLDTQNKGAACRMLHGLSKRMQIVLLTGEQETKEIMSLLPDVALINLPHADRAADEDDEDAEETDPTGNSQSYL
jgi:uncharacterized protein YhaN